MTDRDAAHSTPGLRDYLTIFLVSAAVMLYQIALTRVLSVVVWYHFAFLTISLVMLGLGAPGIWFAFTARPLRFLPGLLLASGLCVPASVALVTKFGAAMLEQSIVAIVLCVLPATLSLGAVVCLMLIKAQGAAVSRMYGADLLGAGLAAATVIPLMHVVPTPHLAAACGLLPLACLALHGGLWGRLGMGAAVVICAVLVQGEALQVTRSKDYRESDLRPIYEKWSPTARLTVFDDSSDFLQDHERGFSWGRGTRYPEGSRVRQYWLEQDGNAGTPITEFKGDIEALGFLNYDVTTVGYQLRPPRSAAVIGAGGGRDILSALLNGATDIDAVELNPHTIALVSERFGDLSGRIYHAPGVNAIASEGRSHLTHTSKSFDLIQISLIDSWAASAAGAFALAENNLYTVEAFALYARRLSERGLISTSRWISELPRLIVLAYAALESMEVKDPRRHIAIVSASSVATLLLSKNPFTRQDLDELDAICEQRGFMRLYPVRRSDLTVAPFIVRTVDEGLAPMAEVGLNVAPPTDDSPYFFHLVSPFTVVSELPEETRRVTGLRMNLKSAVVLRQAMFSVGALSLLFFMAPLIARRAGSLQEPLALLIRGTFYFAAIGGAFMLIENMLVQRFVLYLGHPSYATTVIIASLLLGMGVGSSVADRVGLGRLKRYALLVPLAILLLAAALTPLFASTLGVPLMLRIAMSCAVLLPLGAMLGLFFPLGMIRFGDGAKPWYWAINGAFGVVASVMSLALSMEFGYSVVAAVAALGYATAWACLLGGD